MVDQRIQYTEEMVGAGHPSKADTLNRLDVVEHNTDGTHKAAAVTSLLELGLRGLTGFDGIVLRTDPDKDSAAVKVKMLPGDNAQAILSNGERVALSSILTFDITASGINGKMSGETEAAPRWWEVYLCKGSSGQGLLGREAKRYFEDETQTTNDTNHELREGATTNVKLAQTFDTDTTGFVEFVDIRLFRQAAVSGRIWATIEALSGGDPDGTPLATSDKIKVDALPVSSGFIRIPFRSPASLTAGTTYALVLQGDYTASATVNIVWRSNSAGGYAAGIAKTYNGTAWSDIAGHDFAFKVFVTIPPTELSLPAGYADGSALLGYVYNDSGSDLQGFIQAARYVRLLLDTVAGYGLGTSTATIPTLADISTFIPPVPVVLKDLHGGHSTADRLISVSGVPDGHESAGGIMLAGTAGRNINASATDAGAVLGDCPTEFQALYHRGSSGTHQVFIGGYEF